MMASDWLRFAPSGSLVSIALPHYVGADIELSEGELAASQRANVSFANHAPEIASNASAAEENAWMPAGFELVRAEGTGTVQPVVTAALNATATERAAVIARNLRRLTHADEDDL
jgi:hypothetical protein